VGRAWRTVRSSLLLSVNKWTCSMCDFEIIRNSVCCISGPASDRLSQALGVGNAVSLSWLTGPADPPLLFLERAVKFILHYVDVGVKSVVRPLGIRGHQPDWPQGQSSQPNCLFWVLQIKRMYSSKARFPAPCRGTRCFMLAVAGVQIVPLTGSSRIKRRKKNWF